jgi:hypothetical protein
MKRHRDAARSQDELVDLRWDRPGGSITLSVGPKTLARAFRADPPAEPPQEDPACASPE